MELKVKERLVLLQTLANIAGNLTELRIIRELKEDLSFTEEDHKKYGIQYIDGGGIRWSDTTSTKEIEIGDVAKRTIVKKLKELDRAGQLTEDHLEIIDLFPEVEE